MNQAEYVVEARALQDRHAPKLGVRVLLPGGGKWQLRQLADSLTALLTDLQSLDPPASDASDLEIHFIAPMTELATYLHEQAERVPKGLTVRRAMAILKQGPRPNDADREFCQRYGLEDTISQASFPERAAQVGVNLSSWRATPLTAEQLRRISLGGPSSRTILLIAFVIGAVDSHWAT